MEKQFFPNRYRFSALPLAILLTILILSQAGCSHKKTNRGHLFRCDWAFEYNRTPWVGCPPDSGCDDERGCSISGCGCGDSEGKGFRRHCGAYPGCTTKNPCCRSLGCGMWVDANTLAGMSSCPKSCGLTPFCSPMKPCGLTPACGRVTASMIPQQPVMLGNGGMIPQQQMMPSTLPTPIIPKKGSEGSPEKGQEKRTPTVASPGGMLISMGIVPGISTVTTGGVVAAAGVATPVGIMTPAGVQLPNGMLNNQAVIKACVMHPGCTAARPCGLSPGCGMMVPVAMVSNNAMRLASALTAPGVAGGVMQAGGMYAPSMSYVNGNVMQTGGIPVGRIGGGMLANPVAGMPVSGLTMSGGPQVGYPPIGYAPSGYSPGYAQFDELGLAAGLQKAGTQEEQEEEPEAEMTPETRSRMPVPRFHPVPSKPAFQRSEGLPTAPKVKSVSRTSVSMLDDDSEKSSYSEEALKEAMEQAYLEGMSTAMEEVEAELDAKAEQLAQSTAKSKVLQQAARLQAKIDARQEEELRQEEIAAEQMRRMELQARRQAELKARQEAVAYQRQLQAQMIQIQQQEQAQLARQQMQYARMSQRQNANASGETGFLQTAKSAVGSTISPLKDLITFRPQNDKNAIKRENMMSSAAKKMQSRPHGLPAATSPYSHHFASACPTESNIPMRPPVMAQRPQKIIQTETDNEILSAVQQANYIDRD